MNKEDLYQRIARILHESFDIDVARISPEARLRDDLDIDSIDAVELIVQLKPLFGGNLKPEAFRMVRTVSDVVDALYGMMQATADAPAGV
ncbi:MAG: acyl carrier protein [Lysobacteraceae bacterium]